MTETATKLPAVMVPQPAAMSLDAMQRLAESVAKSGLFGIKTADQALTLMSIAQAEGRHPALAARDYHIIQGAPAKKAEAMARDFLSAGGRIEWHQLDDEAADATFSHPAGGSARIRWDQARVLKAGLGTNQMHKKYPRQMLRSRVVSEGVRTVWPMATSGMYVPEEVSEFAPRRSAEPLDITPRSQLDQFAALPSTETVNAQTGEITDSPAMLAARHGTEAFREYWRDLTPDERAMLKPDLAKYQRAAEAADRPQEEDEDPFGLPQLAERAEMARDATSTENSPTPSPIGSEADPSEPSAQPDDGRAWLTRVSELAPQPVDLASDEPDWPRYATAMVELIASATATDLAAMQVSKMPHMQRMRTQDGDEYARVQQAISARAKEVG